MEHLEADGKSMLSKRLFWGIFILCLLVIVQSISIFVFRINYNFWAFYAFTAKLSVLLMPFVGLCALRELSERFQKLP